MSEWKSANQKAIEEFSQIHSFLIFVETCCHDFDQSREKILNLLKKTSGEELTATQRKKLIEIIESIPSQQDIVMERERFLSGYKRFRQVIKRKDQIFPLAQKQYNNLRANKTRFQQLQENAIKYGEIYRNKRLELMRQHMKDREANRQAIQYTQAQMVAAGLKKYGERTLKNYESTYLAQATRPNL
ncbi:hypothetical protein [uncultured Victivallis sp.]|uniref:hypothetical protein n=1 Tax=uncultured Victivallis sp. TaxID=354118 RepID=UPI00258D0861|nr:hypothetical protein [uncultured Victivallis sp.]